MATNERNGQSVYIDTTGQREHIPLYQAVRELTLRYWRQNNQTGHIFDLGCSDGIASRQLAKEGLPVIGLELDHSALVHAHKLYRDMCLVRADITRLPIPLPQLARPNVFLMLDVLEHLTLGQAHSLLGDIRRQSPESTLIINLPICGPTIPTAIELSGVALRLGRRPEKGIFDRTHQWLTDAEGHRRFLAQAGYQIVEAHYNSPVYGVTGDWQTVTPRSRPTGTGLILKGLDLTAKAISATTGLDYHQLLAYQSLLVARPLP